MLLHDIINEINNLRNSRTQRSAIEILNMLENNRQRLLQKMDADEFNSLIRNFEALADQKPAETRTERFYDDFDKAYNLLRYYLDKII